MTNWRPLDFVFVVFELLLLLIVGLVLDPFAQTGYIAGLFVMLIVVLLYDMWAPGT